jgi:adenylosuccinate lyase
MSESEPMLICPLDYRYGREVMKTVLSEERRLEAQLQVEAALARAHGKFGDIPAKAAETIASRSTPSVIKLERVKQIEAKTKHDVMALVKAITEKSGAAGKYVHLGATSSDIVDTATALQIKDALQIIERDVARLIGTIAALASKHRDTIMLGRTHGQSAIPITFGFKLAGYVSELQRYQERIAQLRPRICVGKMSGAVGTGAAFGKNFEKVQAEVMRQLGLGVEEAATQVVCRDRYAELVSVLAMLCTSCERYATEIRNLQRSEIDEVEEAFDAKKQVGSSTMAQKRNPTTSENACGLARVVRGFVVPTLEDMPLWHERDLTNSSAERFIIPHVFVLTDDILTKMEDVFAHLVVRPAHMRRNLENAHGLVMAEAVMIALANKGMGRQEAHELVRKASLAAEKGGVDLKQKLLASKEAMRLMTKRELDAAMNPSSYVGASGQIVDRVVASVLQPKKRAKAR